MALRLTEMKRDLRGLPVRPEQVVSRRSYLDPLLDFALLQGVTRTGPPLARLSSLGFRRPYSV
jgi:hypothetical protein